MNSIIHRRSTCRACGGKELQMVFALNPTPIGDEYVGRDKVAEFQPSYPIDLYLCRQCGLVQIIDVIDPKVLYGSYIYVTQSSPGLNAHFSAYAQHVVKRCSVEAGAFIMDLGSNDGTLLRSFKALGMRVLGVEPATHIAEQAIAGGVETVSRFFDLDVARQIVFRHGRATVVTANNVFANIDDLGPWVNGINELLANNGVFIFESYYLADVIENMVFDFIYHEHLSSFSVRPIQMLFEKVGLDLAVVERVTTKGGSLRYFLQRPDGPLTKDGSVADLLDSEERAGLYRKETYGAFASKINHLKVQSRQILEKARSDGKSIAGFGASITCTTLIYHFEIGEYLEYLVDDNPAKQGLYSPGLHLQVLPSTALYERKPAYLVLLAWRFADAFMKQHQNYLEQGGCFIVPVPEFKIIRNG